MVRKIDYWKEYGPLIKFLGFFFLLFVVLALLQPIILHLIQGNSSLNETYEFIKNQLTKNSIIWLFIISFAGALFFISIPIDIFFLYYIVNSANPWICILASLIGVMIGRSFDLWFGYLFRDYAYKNVIKEHKKYFNKKFSKWESMILFFGNLIPMFPIEPFVVFIGTTKYKYTKFLVYHGLGKLLKLILIVLFVKFFLQQQVLLSFNFFEIIRSMMAQLLSFGR